MLIKQAIKELQISENASIEDEIIEIEEIDKQIKAIKSTDSKSERDAQNKSKAALDDYNFFRSGVNFRTVTVKGEE